MFNNIGEKIKTLVKIVVIVCSALFITYGLYLIFREESNSSVRVYGLLIAIIGPILSWISGFLIYGFGELIEKISSIEEILLDKKENTKNELREILVAQMEEKNEEEELASTFYNPNSEK